MGGGLGASESNHQWLSVPASHISSIQIHAASGSIYGPCDRRAVCLLSYLGCEPVASLAEFHVEKKSCKLLNKFNCRIEEELVRMDDCRGKFQG